MPKRRTPLQSRFQPLEFESTSIFLDEARLIATFLGILEHRLWSFGGQYANAALHIVELPLRVDLRINCLILQGAALKPVSSFFVTLSLVRSDRHKRISRLFPRP